MTTSSSAAAGFGSTRCLRAACCLALGLVLSLAACDGAGEADQDAEARKHAELKARLDALLEESERQEELLQRESERMAEQQKQAEDKLAAVVWEAYGDTPEAASSDSGGAITSLKDAPVGGGLPAPSNGSAMMLPDDMSPEDKAKRRFEWIERGIELRTMRVMGEVKAVVADLNGEIDTSKPALLIYFMPGPELPWTATYRNGSLILSQKVVGVPDDPGLLDDIRYLAGGSDFSNNIQLTSSFQPNGRKIWYLEVSRTLPREALNTNEHIAGHVETAWLEHLALLIALEKRRPDLAAHIKPVVKTQRASKQPAAATGREPTEAEMLQAMRNHWAARAGSGMFTLTGVQKISAQRLSANQYRIVYVPQMRAEGEDLMSLLIAATPRGKNIATFTYANGVWHFSGAE